MIAFGVGTGVGVNTAMAASLGVGKKKEADQYAGAGTPLAVAMWFLFALVCWFFVPAYARMSTDSPEVIRDVVSYGRIVCVFSFGLFLESIWTKGLQANGDMKTPMIAQILGAVTNIIFDPLLIFGLFGFPELGVAGAAIATVAGQIVAALVVMKKGYRKSPERNQYPRLAARIFRLGAPNILMQSAYTFYILGLNLILSGFSDQAVTALMVVGLICFEAIPGPMLRVFTADERVVEIGAVGFRFIGISFIPLVTSLIFPVFFQAVGMGLKSSLLTIVRTVVLFVPLGYLFSRFGLTWFWLTFIFTEMFTSLLGGLFYRGFLERPYGKRGPLAGERLTADHN